MSIHQVETLDVHKHCSIVGCARRLKDSHDRKGMLVVKFPFRVTVCGRNLGSDLQLVLTSHIRAYNAFEVSVLVRRSSEVTPLPKFVAFSLQGIVNHVIKECGRGAYDSKTTVIIAQADRNCEFCEQVKLTVTFLSQFFHTELITVVHNLLGGEKFLVVGVGYVFDGFTQIINRIQNELQAPAFGTYDHVVANA